MVLENFKSYGGMKRIGPFHKSFSSVVGPNGSGKSNVIDAMLFVFGKRANKLRQSKVADLIHRSATYPDLEHASVAVHFCMIQEGAAAAASGAAIADDGSAEVPGSAFVVERRAFRNNTSRYYVDGKGASQKEVTDMLRGKGIDLDHNRFLILQGEVEQISLMKPKGATEHETGLLEYLEDIIGSHRFVDDIAAAFTDVEALATERDEKLNRVRVADRSRQELAGQREDALHMLKCSSDVSTAKARLYQARAYKAQRKLDAVAEKRAGFEEQLETERRRLADAEERAEAAAGAAEAAVAAVESARGRMRELDAEFGELEKRDITVREAHKHAKGRMRKLHALVNAQRTKAAEAAATVEELEEATPTMEGELAEAEAAQGPAEEEVKAALDNLRASTAGLRSELNARQAALAPVAERRAVAHAAVEKLEAEASMLRQGSAQATAEAERLAREVARHERELSGAEARADKAAENLTGVAGRLDTAREAMAETRAAEAKATRRAASARAMLEENKSAQERAAGQGRVVQKLSAACAAKGSPMSGVRLYGRLGDLGAVDPSLDVAVSTAAAALEWLVVESTEDGQRCIEHLRRNNLGRAKFLVLDKQGAAAAAMAKPVRLPAGARRLFDLVEADEERFLPAFFFALRNTLVADDIDAARAVAYQGGRAVWRVVTLQGELIDTSGTMSGGGGRPRTGSIRLSSSSSSSSSSRAASAASAPAGGMTASDLRAAEKALHEASDEATALADRATATGREIRSLETMLRAAETAARKARAEVQSLTERLAELRIRSAKADRAAADAKEREETAAERLAEVEEALVAAREGLAEVDEEAGSLRGAVEELEARIQEAGGARLEAAKAASKSIAAAVASGRKAVTKAGVELKAAAKAAAKAGAAAKSAEEEYHALAEKLETTSGEKAAVEADAARVAGAKADAEAALAEAEAASGAARKAAKTSRKELSAISAHVEDVEKAGASVIATGKQLKAAVAEVTKTLAAVRRAHEALLKDIPLDEEEGDVLAEAEVEARAAAEAGAGGGEGGRGGLRRGGGVGRVVVLGHGRVGRPRGPRHPPLPPRDDGRGVRGGVGGRPGPAPRRGGGRHRRPRPRSQRPRDRAVPGQARRVRLPRRGAGRGHLPPRRRPAVVGRPPQAAAGGLHVGLPRHHAQAQGDVPDDHARGRRGAGAGGQPRPV